MSASNLEGNTPIEWILYQEARDKLDRGDFDGALSVINSHIESLAGIWSEIACLEARCYEKKAELSRSLSILEAAHIRGTNNHWVYFQLGSTYRNAGLPEESADAFRKAHALLGWHESAAKSYTFTHDFFSPNIPNWSRWFTEIILVAPINCLEIGSWQGGSATWLLDKVVAPRGGMLTCVDTFEGSSEHASYLGTIGRSIEDIFDANIRCSGHKHLCRKIVGSSQVVLKDLRGEKYDFIYIDGAHEAKYVIQDALLSWDLLLPGAYLLFDDIDFHFDRYPHQDTMRAVQAFITWFAAELEVIEQGRQMLIRRI